MLKVKSKYGWVIFSTSFLGAPVLAWLLGYQGSKLVFVAAGISLMVLVLGIIPGSLVNVFRYERVQYDKSMPFDRVTSLHLTDRPAINKKSKP